MCKKIVSFSKRIFKATTNEMITGSGVFKTLTDSFFGEFKKNLKPKEIAKVYKSASKAVSDYAFQLYKESGQYKEDNKTANKHRKELQKLYAEREKLRSKSLRKHQKKQPKLKVKQVRFQVKSINRKQKRLKRMLKLQRNQQLRLRNSLKTLRNP